MELSQRSFSTSNGEGLAAIRLGLAAVILALGALIYQITLLDQQRGILFVSQKWTAAFGAGILGLLVSLVILGFSWTAQGDRLSHWFAVLMRLLRRLGLINLALFLLSISIYVYLVFGPLGYFFNDLLVRLGVFTLVVFLGGVFLTAAGLLAGWSKNLIVSLLLLAVVYKITTLPDAAQFFVPKVVTYPFSLGWSEASRYYYASLFFAERIYAVAAQPSVLHPSRYLMQAVPFLIPDLPLWLHRLWQVMLWLVFTAGAVYLLAKRLQIEKAWLMLAFTAWAFLFLMQGPVYYHLLVAAMIVIWGFDRRHPWRSLVVVLFASAWAGISRVNWYPMPGLIAATLYFLETPFGDWNNSAAGAVSPWKSASAYLLKPVMWFAAGTLAAFGSQALYVLWSGVDPRLLTSSFTSDLLWYRLGPNPTYPLGILPAILLVAAPLVVLLAAGLRGLHPLRLLGIAATLLVLFAGGVVVSTKIGGGSNLHNLDAFLTLLLITGGYVFFGRVASAPHAGAAGEGSVWSGRLLLASILILPVAFALNAGAPLSLPDDEQVAGALATLQQLTGTAVDQGGEVLFISQRHLLTFDLLPGVPLVEKYENVFLMEMAMSGNAYYLDSFYQELSRHRFALIISDQQGARLKGSESPFGEENDVWVERVAQPLLQYYERKDLLKRFGIEVLEPKR
ncbi:MAG TPA: hypothetical protein VFZ76_16225 [Anaerolineales bacterium]